MNRYVKVRYVVWKLIKTGIERAINEQNLLRLGWTTWHGIKVTFKLYQNYEFFCVDLFLSKGFYLLHVASRACDMTFQWQTKPTKAIENDNGLIVPRKLLELTMWVVQFDDQPKNQVSDVMTLVSFRLAKSWSIFLVYRLFDSVFNDLSNNVSH